MTNKVMKLTENEKEQMYKAIAIFSETYAECYMTNDEIRLLESARLKLRVQVKGF